MNSYRWTHFAKSWRNQYSQPFLVHCIQYADSEGKGFGDILFSVVEDKAEAICKAHNKCIELVQRQGFNPMSVVKESSKDKE